MNINDLFLKLKGEAAAEQTEDLDLKKYIDELKSQAQMEDKHLESAQKELNPIGHKVMDPIYRPDKWIKVDPDDPNKTQILTVNGEEDFKEDKDLRREKVARVALALQKLIVKRAVAFALGNPIYLNAEPEDDNQKTVLKAVKRVLYDIKERSHNRRVGRNLFSCTEVAEYWYPVKKNHKVYGFDSKFKLRCAIFSPLKGDKLYPYFDETGDMVAFSREFTVEKDKKKTTYFETYTEEIHVLFRQGEKGFEIVEGYPHKVEIGKIPIVYGKEEQVEWADVQNLIDRLEKLLSNFADTNDYHASPKIVVKGELTGFAKKGEAGAILQLEGEDASAQYLSWQNAPESVKLEIETLLRMIYTISQTPDISFDSVKGLGAISGIALKLLFMDAHLKVQDHSEVLDEYMQRRMSIIKAYIGKFNVTLASAAEDLQIEPEIIPYMIDDEIAKIEKWTKANGGKPIISQKQSMILADLSKDPEADFEQLQEESDRERQFTFNEPTEV